MEWVEWSGCHPPMPANGPASTASGRSSPGSRSGDSGSTAPVPLYYAATKAVRKAFWEAYATFVAAFRDAADRWREGDRSARFPIGSFPPGLPFVKAEATDPP